MLGSGDYQTISEAARALAAGATTSEQLTNAALLKIERLNPRIGAVTDLLSQSASEEARRADIRRSNGSGRGMLDGIPVLVKDCIDTAGASCSAGLPFLSAYRPDHDAVVVQRLRQAGAVVLGVCASDPAMLGTRTLAVTHPQAPLATVGGSSGGSAAALAAGFAFAALGTDTGGSVRIPAACCLTVGLKPTFGRVSNVGVRPLAPSADHVGSLARCVADVTAVAEVVYDRFVRVPSRPHGQGLKIGHAPEYWQDAAAEAREGMEAALHAAKGLGGQLVEISLPSPDEFAKFHLAIVVAEGAAYHFQNYPDHLDTYGPLGQWLFETARRQPGYEYVQACSQRLDARRRVDALFDEVDFLLVPTMPITPPVREAEVVTLAGVDHRVVPAMVRYTALFNHTGHPVVSLPVSVVAPGIGTSVQIVGKRDHDNDVLALAMAIEQELALPIDRTVMA